MKRLLFSLSLACALLLAACKPVRSVVEVRVVKTDVPVTPSPSAATATLQPASRPSVTPPIADTPAPTSTVTAVPSPSPLPPTPTILPTPTPARLDAVNAGKVQALLRLGDGTLSESPALSPDGRFLAMPTSLGVHLYDALSWREIALLPPERFAGQTVFAPEGEIIAACDGNGVQVWNTGTRQALASFSVDAESWCLGLTISPDGALLGGGFSDGQVRVWRLSDQELVATLPGSQAAFSATDPRLVVFASAQAQISVYTTGGFTPIQNFPGERAFFLADGGLVTEQNGAIRVWDRNLSATRLVFDGKAAAASPNGRYLAFLQGDTVRIHQLVDGNLLGEMTGRFDDARSLLFSPDSRYLAGLLNACESPNCAYPNPVSVVWLVESGKTITRQVDASAANWLLYGADHQTLIAARPYQVDVLSLNDGQVLTQVGQFSTSVAGVAFSPDGQFLGAASGAPANQVQLWDVAGGKRTALLQDPANMGDAPSLDVAFSSDGALVALRGTFWRIADGSRLDAFEKQIIALIPFWPSSVAFGPDGRTLALGFLTGQIQVWDLADQSLRYTLAGFSSDVADLDFSPDGAYLAAVYAYPDNTLQVWRAADGSAVQRLGSDFFRRTAFSPDGQYLAVITARDDLDSGDVLQVWRWAEAQKIYTTSSHAAISLAYNPEGSLIVTGSQDGNLRLWQAEDGKLLNTLSGHRMSVSGVAFAPNGQFLASSSVDGTLRIWGLAAP